MNIQLKVNQKYTCIRISGFATCVKYEIIITGIASNGSYICKNKGKRKEYYFNGDLRDMLLFEGHGLPLLVDSETNRFFGNAKLNFVTDEPEKLRTYIGQNCLNPDLEVLHKIRVTPTDRNKVDGEGVPLFPETDVKE